MATSGKAGGKRAIYFTCSTGKIGDAKRPAVEFRTPCPWTPGMYKPKKKSRNW